MKARDSGVSAAKRAPNPKGKRYIYLLVGFGKIDYSPPLGPGSIHELPVIKIDLRTWSFQAAFFLMLL